MSVDTPTVTREQLAVVLWARLLDQAPLTIGERCAVARFQAIVLSEDDEIAAEYRTRCLREVA